MSNINNDNNDSKQENSAESEEYDPEFEEWYANREQERRDERAQDKSYTKQYQRSKSGSYYSNLANACIAGEHDGKFENIYAYDRMRRLIINNASIKRPLEDADVDAAQQYLQDKCFLRNISKQTTHQMIKLLAVKNEFHPVENYINSLSWDGENRCIYWLHKGMGAEFTLYTSSIGKWFLTSMIARIMDPGCQCDYMLVFEGPQGILKSTACKILAGEWFSDQLPEIGSKDASAHVTSKWVIEIAEMHAFNRADTFHLKSFITRTHERYRAPYAIVEEEVPRSCVFIGTTNQDAYLKDETGGRRFWPVKCGTIDIDWLRANRDQLLAEAHHYYLTDHPWWPSRQFEEQHIKPQQETRHDFDEWQNIVSDWLQRTQTTKEGITMTRVWVEALGMVDKKMGSPDQGRISKILQRLGWVSKRTTLRRYWVHKDAPSYDAV